MALDWRETLRTLLTQFEARAARSSGLNHLLVEVADHERDKMAGPGWFARSSHDVKVVDGQLKFEKWGISRFSGLPLVSPSFREAKSHETFDENELHNVIRDSCGVARAVAVPMKLRQGYYCGLPVEEVSGFESLANSAATALAGSSNLNDHPFASDLTDIFRTPRGGVRYVFGEVPDAPRQFLAQGWGAGVLQFENGVLIDVPIAESAPDSSHWLLLLHRLGWRRIAGTGLRAERNAWNGNIEVAFEMLAQDWSQYPDAFSKQFASISKESYYSVLGTKDVPLDVNLASVFAIQALLADLTPEPLIAPTEPESFVDYSGEEWASLAVPLIRTQTHDECKEVCVPRIGILVATEVERLAVLKKMRPPRNKRAVLQVYSGNNTCFVGRLGVTDIVLCMTAMGSVGRDASMMVTVEIIQSWELAAVIMVGIAFGKDSAKQGIGNVLVSDRIIPYEPERVGVNSSEDRGNTILAGTVLLNRFRNVVGWNFKAPNGRRCGFQTGSMLSGEKLVDNDDFKRRLFERYPTAIGGEMEGAGVAAAAARKSREWIIVKAICDWGDGTKTKQHQGFAAASSIDLVEHVLNQVGALDALA
jgi:nucleoside phosphorylase